MNLRPDSATQKKFIPSAYPLLSEAECFNLETKDNIQMIQVMRGNV